MKKYFCVIILIMTHVATFAQKNQKSENNLWTSSRPDGHAPISIMGDHSHNKGEFMISYRYMRMNMQDLRNESDDINLTSVLLPNGGIYMVTPTEMPMQMHMLGAMYAISNKVTIMTMLNYMSSEMEHLTAMGGNFITESSGFGDIQLSALYKLIHKNRQQLLAQLGVSIPTGSINIKDVTPASAPNEVVLPYPMQIGSGTVDAVLALTYLGQSNNLSWGSQFQSKLRFGTSDNDYRLGNQYKLNSWLAVKAANWLSFSGKLEGLVIDKLSGANPALNPMMVTTADTNNLGGSYLNAGLGFNTYISKGSLKNVRFGFEVVLPMFQKPNGIQLKQKESLIFGMQYSL